MPAIKPSSLTPTLRAHLEWSWNYSTAEAMADDTCRHNAQWIADGVVPGQEETDEDLLEDFARNRVGSEDEVDSDWAPESPEDQNLLRKLLLPIIDKLKDEDLD